MKFTFLIILSLLFPFLISSQNNLISFHEKHETQFDEKTDSHQQLHFANIFFTEKNLSKLFPEFIDKKDAVKTVYKNSVVPFDRAFELVFNSEVNTIKNIAAKKQELGKEVLRVLSYELYDNVVAKINNPVIVKELYEHDEFLKNQYDLGTGYSAKVMAACTNVDFADGTTNGWQCSWGTGASNQINTVVGYEEHNDCTGLTETYNSTTRLCCWPSIWPFQTAGCRTPVFSTVAITANINNPAVTLTANSGVVNTAANAGSPGVHTIMTSGNDPLVPIPVVPPSGGKSIRLGNANTGTYKAQRLRQTFTVAAGNPNFVYQYAVVLQDPVSNHTISDQPYFKIRMYDQSNNEIDCATYDINAISAQSIGGFTKKPGTDYLYKNWSTVTVPLLSYVGQNVTIEFTTSDCAQSGHFGYAYIQCLCSPLPIVSSLPVICNGQTTTLTAPPGAATYTWTGPGVVSGANTQTAVVNIGGSYTVNMSTFYSFPQTPCFYSQSITLGGAPAPASSSFTSVPVCLGVQNTFTNTSSGSGIFQYVWNFGDGSPTFTTATLTNPVHTYTTAGNYSVSLIADNGCPQPFSLPLSIKPQPTAAFTLSNSCMGLVTNITNSSTAPAPATFASQAWDFGDGSTSATMGNTAHTYTAPSTYSVSLLVVNDQQCRDSITKTITIYPNPVVAIGSNTVCLNLTTAFTNSTTVASPDNISIWAWDFDNNGTADNGAQFPTNTFATVGTHTVELKAITNNGCRDSTTIPVVVNAIQTAVFTASNVCLNSPISIVNTTTVSPPDFITDYNWDFGVGANPATGTGYNPTLPSYSSSGTKTITLNLTANTSCIVGLVQTIQVYAQPVANFTTTSVCQSTATVFNDLSTSTGTITNWQWDFLNDGSIDNSTNSPSNTYLSSGTFSTALIVTDNNTCKDTVVLPVNIWGHAIPDFSPDAVCFGSSTTFTNLTNTTTNANIGSVSNYEWNFADGSPLDVITNPSHTYTTGIGGATYNVTLTATTSHGCIDFVVKPVKINALPTATFSAANACLNSNVVLSNSSSVPLPDNLTLYSWNFGSNANPATSGSLNPALLSYSTSGIKTISLTITANTTCTASVTQTIVVYPQPIANFSATSVCQSTATIFNDLSTSSGTITNWQWDFLNDGSIDNTTSAPTNTYANSGTFSAALIVTDNNTCKDTIVLPVNIWGHTIPDFTPNSVCYGTATTFTNLTNTTTNANVGGTPSYTWNFSDGTATTIVSDPIHTYNIGANGNATYNVTLTVTSSHNCIDSITKTVNVYAVPTASFTSDSVCLGTPSHMIDVSNGNGNILNNYEWDFLSNSTVDVIGVANPNFTFPAYGINVVTYTVSTNPIVGLTCKNITNTITVWVNPKPTPDFTFVNNCINAQPNTFDANSSSIAIGTNTNYAWAYGDAASGSGVVTNHNYATAQTYNATLTVASNKGCQASITKQVEVYKKPAMNILNSAACDGKSMTFTATVLPGGTAISNWYWDFDNTISTIEATGATTNFIFPAAGTQTVSLITEATIGGCRDTLKVPVYVDYLPTPQFSVNIPAGCPLPHCVTFTDQTPTLTAPGQNVDWKWVFGDGTELHSTTNGAQSKCYTNSSSIQSAFFDVKLVVTTNKGCKDSLLKPSFITVYPKPIANYIVAPNPSTVLTPLVYFTNQSEQFTKWWWNYNANYNVLDSINYDGTHYYENLSAGTYPTYLIVANQFGCKDTANVLVDIKPEFTFYIPNAFSPANNDGVNDIFSGAGIGIAEYEMWIFDRWGARIYYTDDIHHGWNGKVQGKEEEVQQDVYIWKVKIKDVLGKTHEYIGHVTLLR